MAFGWGNGWGYSWGLSDPILLLIPTGDMLPVNLTASWTEHPLPLGDRGLFEYPVTEYGAFTGTQPIDENELGFSGFQQFTFFDDFYKRAYVIPKLIDFGIITSNTSRIVTIWNAHLTPIDLTAVDDLALQIQGVEVDKPTFPYELGALVETPAAVLADVSGTTEVEGVATFTFSTGQTIPLTVVGIRGLLWPFMPNWSGGFRETRNYKTEIIQSYSGREQRLAQRDVPRKSIEFTAHVHHEERRELNRLLDAFQHVEFVVPDLPRAMTAVDPVPDDQSTFAVDDVPAWLEVGMLIVCVKGRTAFLRQVEAFDSGANTISFENTGLAMPAGTRLCFAFIGYLNSSTQTRRLTGEVVEMTFRFDTKPGIEARTDVPAAPETYNGREVFLAKPNWSDPVDLESFRFVEELDYGRGVIARFSPVEYGNRIVRATHTARNYASYKALVDTFDRARGQCGEFYRATGEDDLPVKTPLLVTTATLRTQGIRTFESYKDLKTFKHIVVHLKDGTRLYRSVTSITTVSDSLGEDTILQLGTTWASTVQVSDIARVSWLQLCRFASDGLTIDWLTSDKARMQFNIRSIEDNPAD